MISIIVDHLSKYLAMRLTLDLENEIPEADRMLNFCIYINPHSLQFLVLNGNQTLQQVSEKFWKVSENDCIVLAINSRLLTFPFHYRQINRWKCSIHGRNHKTLRVYQKKNRHKYSLKLG